MRRFLTVTYSWARRCAIAVLGGSIVLIGILMIVFPGPAFIVIPAGLAVLGLEFECARRWLRQLRTTGTDIVGRTRVWLRPKSAARTASKVPEWEQQPARLLDRPNRVQRARASTKTGYYRVP